MSEENTYVVSRRTNWSGWRWCPRRRYRSA